jgi:F0F1-type ATP synthase assembly protein I
MKLILWTILIVCIIVGAIFGYRIGNYFEKSVLLTIIRIIVGAFAGIVLDILCVYFFMSIPRK